LPGFTRYLPVLGWARRYTTDKFADDAIAASIVAILLIPQSLAYALLAGLPAEMGLYASIIGLLIYGLFGTSSSLSVGPVAIISLMTATALNKLFSPGSAEYIAGAMTLAAMSGFILILLGLFRLGFIANFLSIPVIAAFITAAGLVIAAGQLNHLLGIPASGNNLPEILGALWISLPDTHLPTVIIAALALLLIAWVRLGLKPLLLRLGLTVALSSLIARVGPVIAVLITALLAFAFKLDAAGVALVGELAFGLPAFALPGFSPSVFSSLAASAVLISIIGFVESISVGQTLGAKKRQQVDPDQELVGLGVANVAVSIGGGFPVTGGLSRSIVNYDAGAATPAAGIFTALLIAAVALLFTPLIYWLPKATLAVTILFAVASLMDFSLFRKAWEFSRSDFAAMVTTFSLTLFVGVEIGIGSGVIVSMLLIIYKMSRPHVAIVGRVPGTEHFRNIHRHRVQTFDNILSLRIDESLYFANTRYMENLISGMVSKNPAIKHVILMCTAVNKIDLSALETLLKINFTLKELDIRLHMSEVKGPVMDALKRTDFFSELTGNCYLSQNQAVEQLKCDRISATGL
jgi:sulfate permease, SulP family